MQISNGPVHRGHPAPLHVLRHRHDHPGRVVFVTASRCLTHHRRATASSLSPTSSTTCPARSPSRCSHPGSGSAIWVNAPGSDRLLQPDSQDRHPGYDGPGMQISNGPVHRGHPAPLHVLRHRQTPRIRVMVLLVVTVTTVPRQRSRHWRGERRRTELVAFRIGRQRLADCALSTGRNTRHRH